VAALAISEGDFERQHVEPLATLHGWRFAHFQDSRREVRPGVHVGDPKARGWPDLALARERVVFAELKSDKGKPTHAQVNWLDALAAAGAECYLWKPDDLEDIGLILKFRWRYLPMGDRTLPVAPYDDPLLTSDSGRIAWLPGCLWIAGRGRTDEGGT
jgi:hypothetical protein